MALRLGTHKDMVIEAKDVRGNTIPLENPRMTDPLLEVVPAGEVNTYQLRPSATYDGTVGVQVPCVFLADGRPGDGDFPVAVDFGTETLFPGDAKVVSGTLGAEVDDAPPN